MPSSAAVREKTYILLHCFEIWIDSENKTEKTISFLRVIVYSLGSAMSILFTDFWQFDVVFVVAILGCCKRKIYIVSHCFEIWIDTANKTEKSFSHIGRNDKYYRFMTIWWRVATQSFHFRLFSTALGYSMVWLQLGHCIAWRMPWECMKTVWRLPDATWQLPMKTTWQLPINCCSQSS